MAKPVGDAEGQSSLDELAADRPGPILVKIDVDGVEIDVLQSGKQLMSRKDTSFLIETHSEELERGVKSLLESHGFRCRIIKNAWWRAAVPESRPIGFNRWMLAGK